MTMQKMTGYQMIHVKHKATDDRPLCGYDPGNALMAWTDHASAPKMATCDDCLQVLFPGR